MPKILLFGDDRALEVKMISIEFEHVQMNKTSQKHKAYQI